MGVDVEWAVDGLADNKIYIIQTRPETVHNNKTNILKKYKLMERGEKLISWCCSWRENINRKSKKSKRYK